MIGLHQLESTLFVLTLACVLGALASASTSGSRKARAVQAALVGVAAVALCTLTVLAGR
jgi:hypothetical protein